MNSGSPFFSIITAVYNREKFVGNALRSLNSQTFTNFESVIVDGGSNDGTIKEINQNLPQKSKFISEPDQGIYDALNKGLIISTGEVIGILHSDDYYQDHQVLQSVYECFLDEAVDIVYGDLNYVRNDDVQQIIRKWRPGDYRYCNLHLGWMPPHPTCFIRRRVFEMSGYFNLNYKISADYDLLIRQLICPNIKAVYLSKVLVSMRTGGISNKSISSIVRKTLEDHKIIKSNNIGGVGTLFMKNFTKIHQFFR